MKTNLFKSIAIAAILVGSTACGSAPASFVGSLTDALDDSAWESSAWISAPDAQVVTGTIYDGTRSADGASCISSSPMIIKILASLIILI